MYGFLMSLIDKLYYKIAEPLYTRKFHCINCNHDYHVKGAMPNRTYFCIDCNMELFKDNDE